MEKTSFGSCCPRLGWRKLVWFISSEAQMEQATFGSYHPRLGQKKEVLVSPVALVGCLNEV